MLADGSLLSPLGSLLPSDPQSLNATEFVVGRLLPPLVPHARVTPQRIVRVHGLLDLLESWVVFAPEGLLPVGFVASGLRRRVSVSLALRPGNAGDWDCTSFTYAPVSGASSRKPDTRYSDAWRACAREAGF